MRIFSSRFLMSLSLPEIIDTTLRWWISQFMAFRIYLRGFSEEISDNISSFMKTISCSWECADKRVSPVSPSWSHCSDQIAPQSIHQSQLTRVSLSARTDNALQVLRFTKCISLTPSTVIFLFLPRLYIGTVTFLFDHRIKKQKMPSITVRRLVNAVKNTNYRKKEDSKL